MAKVEIVFEDGDTVDGSAEPGITIWIRSDDPPLPLKNGDLDLDQATPAQAAVRLFLEEVMGTAKAREILAIDEETMH